MYSTVSGMVFSFNPIRLWMVAKKIFYGLKKTRGTNQKSEIKSATHLSLLGKKKEWHSHIAPCEKKEWHSTFAPHFRSGAQKSGAL